MIHRRATCLLWRHRRRCAEHGPRRRDPVADECCVTLVLLRESEVEHYRVVLGRHHDVAALDVAVNDAVCVGGRQRARYLHRHRVQLAERERARSPRLANALVFVLSFAFALLFWEAVSASGLIREEDLPSMTATMDELWGLVQTRDFWTAFLQTARGWAIGLGLATLLAVPIGIVLGLSDLAGRAAPAPSRPSTVAPPTTPGR